MSAPHLPEAEQRLLNEFVQLLSRHSGREVQHWQARPLPRDSTHAGLRLKAHFDVPVARTALRDAYRAWDRRAGGVMLEADSFEGQSQDIEADVIYRIN